MLNKCHSACLRIMVQNRKLHENSAVAFLGYFSSFFYCHYNSARQQCAWSIAIATSIFFCSHGRFSYKSNIQGLFYSNFLALVASMVPLHNWRHNFAVANIARWSFLCLILLPAQNYFCLRQNENCFGQNISCPRPNILF